MKVRQWAKRYGTIFVVTGGVLEDGLIEIGTEDVDVPRYYYKIVARGDEKNIDVAAFLMEGKESSASLQQFAVTVDELEKRTGIDFFESLDNETEAKLEKKIDLRNWKF